MVKQGPDPRPMATSTAGPKDPGPWPNAPSAASVALRASALLRLCTASLGPHPSPSFGLQGTYQGPRMTGPSECAPCPLSTHCPAGPAPKVWPLYGLTPNTFHVHLLTSRSLIPSTASGRGLVYTRLSTGPAPHPLCSSRGRAVVEPIAGIRQTPAGAWSVSALLMVKGTPPERSLLL